MARSPATRFARLLTLPALLIALLAPPAAAAADTACPDADLQPAPESVGAVRAAVLCLHNEHRAERGLPALRLNGRLEIAAARHSADMVAGRYFDHTTPSGVTLTDRIARVGYMRPGQGWTVGENLAWGSGPRATPREIVTAWMTSPGHRANVLRRSFREIGIGTVLGVPVELSAAQTGATYTANFGVRR